MNQEQIEKLAKEYALDRGFACCENPNARNMMIDAIKWLLRDHLIAEKKFVVNAYDQCKKYSEKNVRAGLEAYDVCKTLESLFNKSTFNPTE